MIRSTDKELFLKNAAFFLFWPLGSLIRSIVFRNSKWARDIFWLFCIYYGYTFVIAGKGIDAYRYVEAFKELSGSAYSFKEFFAYLFSNETKYVDIINPLISFIISRVTSDGRILLAAYGFILGYFYSRNIWYLFDKISNNGRKITFLFIVVFVLIDPIWKLGAFRFASAIHIYIFGILPYLFDGDKRKLWVSFCSIFVHFAFFTPVLVLLVYIMIGNRQNLFFFLFLISFFITEMNIDNVRNQLSFLPDVFHQKAEAYMTQDSYDNQLMGIARTNWYIRNYTTILKYLATIFLMSIYFIRKKFIQQYPSMFNIWNFTMLFYAGANVLFLLPQGIRFYSIANLLVFFLLALISTINDTPKLLRQLMYFSIPVLLLLIIVDIRKGFDFTGLLTIFGNPFIAPFFGTGAPLISFIK
jgi:hypothetical protein